MINHLLVWLAIVVAATFLIPIATSTDRYDEVIRKEAINAESYYGRDDKNAIVRETNNLYLTIAEAGFIGAAKNSIAKIVDNLPRRRNGKALGFIDIPQGGYRIALESPMMSVWLISWRIQNMKMWLIYVMPFAAALIFDGFCRMHIRQSTAAGKASPTRAALRVHAFIAICGISLIMLYVAVPLNVLWYPGALLMIAALARNIVTNLQSSY